jgi:riboflavin biosynthesis pyrimidine reductase
MSLELLEEPAGLPAWELPDELAARYPGTFGFDGPRLVTNFVQTVDGVVAIPALPQSNRLIAGGSEADRFVMGLLRAAAGAVVVGSGTLNGSPRGLWTPEQAYPAAAGAFAELRRRRGLPPSPEVAVLTATGAIDPKHPAVAGGGLVLTTDEGAAALDGRVAKLVALGPGPALGVAAAVAALRERGHGLILSEGGPRVFASLLEAGLVDDLFLTVSPLLAGRPGADGRLALVEGADLVPDGPRQARLEGVRRDGGHLFLRYALSR